MKYLENKLFSTEFLDHWYRHYNILKTYLEQYSPDGLHQVGNLDDELFKWISIQNKIKNKLPFELRSKLAALKLDFNSIDNIWENRYQQLTTFFQNNGQVNLPADEKYEGLKDWLLRQIRAKDYLSVDQVARLELLGVDWSLTITRDQIWQQMYLNLKDFYQAFGHCQVPQNWKNDKPLANWVRVQRQMYAKNKLCLEREKKLNELNFTWHIQVLYDAQWQLFYNKLQAFYQVHGHCRVPGNEKHLTSWIENQRTAKKNNSLLPERERQLNDIGFIWSFSVIKRSYWREKYEQLKAFKQKHGHSFVPINYKENKTLGYWVFAQRKLEAKGKLEEAKKKKLNQLGFVWSSNTQLQLKSGYDYQWNFTFARLKIYHQVYGTCQVSLKINPVLQRWTRWQRKLFYEGKLSKERMAKLNEIKFPWNIQEGYWMKMYEALADFRKQFGHTQVPYQWEANRQLAAWVYRMKLSKTELSPQKVELLDMLGFDWKLSRKTVVSWGNMYARLLQFKQEHGHTRVPVKWTPDPKLGKWVSRMRQERDKLNPKRLALLENIAFNWGKQLA